jgi:molecular chaperone GrpE
VPVCVVPARFDAMTDTPIDSSLPVDPADSTARVAALEAELAEQRDKYVRSIAEFDNFRKRATRERQEAGWRAQGELVRGLIESLDDLSRFAHVDPATVTSTLVVDGIAMVEKKMLKSLAGHGLEIVHPLDQPFNPSLHEAVGTAEAAQPEFDGTVGAVYQVGYVINGHLLRPARVVVRQWSGASAAAPTDAPTIQ